MEIIDDLWVFYSKYQLEKSTQIKRIKTNVINDILNIKNKQINR